MQGSTPCGRARVHMARRWFPWQGECLQDKVGVPIARRGSTLMRQGPYGSMKLPAGG